MPERYAAYKAELKPNGKQKSLMARHAGAARWAYNLALEWRTQHYRETGESISHIDVNRRLVQLKKTDPSYGWLRQLSSACIKESFRNLDQAFQNYFRSIKGKARRAQHPRYKKRKGVGHGSFRLFGCIHVGPAWIQLPRLGRVRLKRRGYIPTDERPISATVSENAGRWFVAVKFRRAVPEVPRSENQATIGVDLGLKNVAVLSDGTVHESHQHHRRQLRRLRFLNKSVARKQKGSQNWRKAMQKLRRLHYRVACQRNDQLHKITTDLVRRFGCIGIETLNVTGMHRSKRIRKRAHDSAIYEFVRQLEYKAEWAGVAVVKADMWWPSSQLCSRCGERHRGLSLRDSTFVCPACGFTIDRDLNAARNLEQLAQASLATGAVATACRDAVRPDLGSARVNEAGSRQNAGS